MARRSANTKLDIVWRVLIQVNMSCEPAIKVKNKTKLLASCTERDLFVANAKETIAAIPPEREIISIMRDPLLEELVSDFLCFTAEPELKKR